MVDRVAFFIVVTLSRLWSVVLLFIYILPHFVEDVKCFFQMRERLDWFLWSRSVAPSSDILIIAQDLLFVKGFGGVFCFHMVVSECLSPLEQL